MIKNNIKTHSGFAALAVVAVLALVSVSAVAVHEYRAQKSSPDRMAEVALTEETEGQMEVSVGSAEEIDTKLANIKSQLEGAGLYDEAFVETNVIRNPANMKEIIFAGGCFWCTEAYMQETAGVTSAVSVYIGGSEETATYKQVSSKNTNHREAVKVDYDVSEITLPELLEVYWSHIDPTDAGGQFADRGPQYETAIYYYTEDQREIIEASKKALEESGLFDEPTATEILPYVPYYVAEEYHQDYYQKASGHYERYKKASGRAGFIEDNWAKEAALQFFNEQENQQSTEGKYQEREWTQAEIEAAQAELPADVYHVVVEEGTERAYQNAYWDNKEAGIYVDVITGKPLYSSTHKYDSGTGWPSFYQGIDENDLVLVADYKLAVPRVEVRSQSGHLGHVFDDGPAQYGGKRHCINSLALNFIPKEEMEVLGYGEYTYLFE